MVDRKHVSGMSGIEWASVSKYLHWLEVQSKLMPFSISAVYSFRVSKGGFSALAGEKRRLLSLLEGNLVNLQRWVKVNEGEMTELERVFARSLWRTTQAQVEVVKEHLDRAKELHLATKTFEIPTGGVEGCGDELPF